MKKKPIRIEIRKDGNTLAIVRMDTQEKLDVVALDDVEGAQRAKRKWTNHYNS
jgi:hypothetical protein